MDQYGDAVLQYEGDEDFDTLPDAPTEPEALSLCNTMMARSFKIKRTNKHRLAVFYFGEGHENQGEKHRRIKLSRSNFALPSIKWRTVMDECVPSEIASVCFSPCGRYLAVLCMKGSLHLWTITKRRIHARPKGERRDEKEERVADAHIPFFKPFILHDLKIHAIERPTSCFFSPSGNTLCVLIDPFLYSFHILEVPVPSSVPSTADGAERETSHRQEAMRSVPHFCVCCSHPPFPTPRQDKAKMLEAKELGRKAPFLTTLPCFYTGQRLSTFPRLWVGFTDSFKNDICTVGACIWKCPRLDEIPFEAEEEDADADANQILVRHAVLGDIRGMTSTTYCSPAICPFNAILPSRQPSCSCGVLLFKSDVVWGSEAVKSAGKYYGMQAWAPDGRIFGVVVEPHYKRQGRSPDIAGIMLLRPHCRAFKQFQFLAFDKSTVFLDMAFAETTDLLFFVFVHVEERVSLGNCNHRLYVYRQMGEGGRENFRKVQELRPDFFNSNSSCLFFSPSLSHLYLRDEKNRVMHKFKLLEGMKRERRERREKEKNENGRRDEGRKIQDHLVPNTLQTLFVSTITSPMSLAPFTTLFSPTPKVGCLPPLL
mmetsp:Transcript_46355/g.119628  ORF Transcript_46355/g.119628 Transcript_46355/m.119628 type:complete len:597 (-) Transcript_46355:6-1796(-)